MCDIQYRGSFSMNRIQNKPFFFYIPYKEPHAVHEEPFSMTYNASKTIYCDILCRGNYLGGYNAD